jgi:phosphoribosyl-dephospho-CoA transferase
MEQMEATDLQDNRAMRVQQGPQVHKVTQEPQEPQALKGQLVALAQQVPLAKWDQLDLQEHLVTLVLQVLKEQLVMLAQQVPLARLVPLGLLALV